MALSAERGRRTENVFHMLLRACETLWGAREIALVALSAKQQRHTEIVCHMPFLKHVKHSLLQDPTSDPTSDTNSFLRRNRRWNL